MFAYTATMKENGSGFENFSESRSSQKAQSGSFSSKTNDLNRVGIYKTFKVRKSDKVVLEHGISIHIKYHILNYQNYFH
jgi:hypothetical protein